MGFSVSLCGSAGRCWRVRGGLEVGGKQQSGQVYTAHRGLVIPRVSPGRVLVRFNLPFWRATPMLGIVRHEA